MAYPCRNVRKAVRVPYFSNPDVTYKGSPTGIAGKNDNARRIKENMVRLATIRRSTTVGLLHLLESLTAKYPQQVARYSSMYIS